MGYDLDIYRSDIFWKKSSISKTRPALCIRLAHTIMFFYKASPHFHAFFFVVPRFCVVTIGLPHTCINWYSDFPSRVRGQALQSYLWQGLIAQAHLLVLPAKNSLRPPTPWIGFLNHARSVAFTTWTMKCGCLAVCFAWNFWHILSGGICPRM